MHVHVYACVCGGQKLILGVFLQPSPPQLHFTFVYCSHLCTCLCMCLYVCVFVCVQVEIRGQLGELVLFFHYGDPWN